MWHELAQTHGKIMSLPSILLLENQEMPNPALVARYDIAQFCARAPATSWRSRLYEQQYTHILQKGHKMALLVLHGFPLAYSCYQYLYPAVFSRAESVLSLLIPSLWCSMSIWINFDEKSYWWGVTVIKLEGWLVWASRKLRIKATLSRCVSLLYP